MNHLIHLVILPSDVVFSDYMQYNKYIQIEFLLKIIIEQN